MEWRDGLENRIMASEGRITAAESPDSIEQRHEPEKRAIQHGAPKWEPSFESHPGGRVSLTRQAFHTSLLGVCCA